MRSPPDVQTGPWRGPAAEGLQEGKKQPLDTKEGVLRQAVSRRSTWEAILAAVADQRDRLAVRLALADHDIEAFLLDRDLEADVEIFDRLTLALAEFLQARRAAS